jgi:16S rRNA (adenine1518-N6/adenine1519-N6)-dimethyltransferase
LRSPVKAKKHLGQHFLRDENVAIKIVEALPLEGFEQVIEIGPGDGVLSKYLLDRYDNILFFDVDQESITHLENAYPMHRDKFILQDFIAFKPTVQTAVIGNFPYNISSQIVFHILDYKELVPVMVGMFQKEVAKRIASPPGSKEYGILSVLTQAYYELEYLFTVDEHVFEPAPKVKSGVITMKRKANLTLDCDEKFFKALVKKAFNQRRKMLRNSVKEFLNEENIKLVQNYLEMRPEQLHFTDFVAISKALFPK